MGVYPYNPDLGQKLQGDPSVPPVDRLFIMHYQIAPAATGVNTVHSAITLPGSGTLEVTDGITNPDVPRTITITGSQSGITGNVVIAGTDAAGNVITETLAANGTATVESTRAFKTVTSITVPAKNATGDTISVGTGKKVGLPRKVYNANFKLVSLFNGSTDAGTLTVDGSDLSKNLYSIAGTPNGSKVLDLVILVSRAVISKVVIF